MVRHALLAALCAVACAQPAVADRGVRAGVMPIAQAAYKSKALQASEASVLDATSLMNWAERAYPQFFPTAEADRTAAPYIYRYYPGSGNYIGVAGDEVSVLGPISGGQVVVVGRLGDFRCQVLPQDCESPGSSRVMAFSHRSAGLADDRSLVLWGDWDYPDGQLVPGSGARSAPIAAIQLVALEGGRSGIVLAEDRKVYAWGMSAYGKPPHVASAPGGPINRLVEFPRPVQKIAHDGRLLAILDDGSLWEHLVETTGTVQSWRTQKSEGAPLVRGFGQRLGRTSHVISVDGQVMEIRPPDYLTSRIWTYVPVAGATRVRSMACGWDMCIALRDDFTVVAWGSGYLGNGSTEAGYSATPVAVQGIANATHVTMMTWGKPGDMPVVRLVDGSLLHWGHVGRGAVLPVARPQVIKGLAAVTDVDCMDHCLVRTTDGSVWGWGANLYDELGDSRRTESQPTPVLVPGVRLY